jgi:hypothetical protein
VCWPVSVDVAVAVDMGFLCGKEAPGTASNTESPRMDGPGANGHTQGARPLWSITMRPFYVAVAMLTCVAFAMPTIADEKSSEAVKPRNYAEAAEECEKAIARRKHELANEYSSDVWGLKQKFQKDGNLEHAIVADTEWSRSLSRKPLSQEQLVESPPELAKLQREYLDRFASLAEAVATEFLQDLKTEASELAKAGKLADGKVLQQEIDMIKRLYLDGRDGKARGSDVAKGKVEDDVVSACEEAIRQKRVAMQAQYVGELEALEKSFQAKGALEHLFATKAESKRFLETPLIAEDNLAKKPDALRELQLKYFELQQNVTASVAEEFIAKLEQKKQALTIEGKLDEAIKAKKDAELIRKRYSWPKAPERRSLVGRWVCFSGDAELGACELLQDGQRLIFINERGERARGFQKDESTVISVDNGGLAGTISPDTNVIQWHNGTSWRR